MLFQLEVKPWDGDGTLMTMEEFLDDVSKGCLINYDGFGRYAVQINSGIFETDIVVRPEDWMKSKSFTHVIWYNR